MISIKIHLQGAQNWSSFHKEGVINVNFLSSEKRAQGYKVKMVKFWQFLASSNDFLTAKNLELTIHKHVCRDTIL